MANPKIELIKKILTHQATRSLAGGAAGYGFGRYVSPKLMGYEDNPASVNASTLVDTAIGAGLAGMKGSHWSSLLNSPKGYLGFVGAVPAGEILPIGMNMINQGTQAAEGVTDAAQALVEKPTIQQQVGNVLNSSTAKGVGTGAALAGLGSVITGLLRPKLESERAAGTGRVGMIKNDLMTYTIPAMIAGGVIGSLD